MADRYLLESGVPDGYLLEDGSGVLLLQGPGAYRTAVINDGPLAYWRLGEPSGTLAVDETGNNPGTYVASPTLGVPGLQASDADTAVTFTKASSQYVLGKSGYILAGLSSFTIELWYSGTTPGGPDSLYSESAGAGGQWIKTNVYGDGTARLEYNASGGPGLVLNSGIVVTGGTIHHIVGTMLGTTLSIYVDGLLANSVVRTDGLIFNEANPESRIAGEKRDGAAYLSGTVDEVALYNYALTPAQVYNHFLLGEAPAAPWQGQGDHFPATPLLFDDTDQSYTIQPPVVVGFDPATGFPWTVEDSQQLVAQGITYDSTEQSGGTLGQTPTSFLNEPDPDTPVSLTWDDTAQAWAITTAPVWDPSTGHPWEGTQPDIPAQGVVDDSVQSWAVTTAPVWDPATGWPWQGQQPDVAAVGVVDDTPQTYPIQPVAAAVFDPSTGFPWTSGDPSQDRSLSATYYDGIDGNFVEKIPFNPALFPFPAHDAQQDWSLQPVWFVPESQAWSVQPPAATYNPAAGGYVSADHPIPAWQPWVHLEQPGYPPFATLPAVGAVTGGYGPSGSATSSGMSASASAPGPVGSGANVKPGASASGPVPVGSATGGGLTTTPTGPGVWDGGDVWDGGQNWS